MAMMLYAEPDNYKTHKAYIAANYVGLEMAKPQGSSDGSMRIPILETDQGCVFSANSIARYIARIRRDVGLGGTTMIETGLVDSWMEFGTHELEVPLCVWVYPKIGLAPDDPVATKAAKDDVARALNVLNSHLLHNTYLVGHQITLADISLCCAIAYGIKHVLDARFMGAYVSLQRWFNTLMEQPEFKSVLGQVRPSGAGKEQAQGQAKPKAEPKAKADAKAKAEPKAKSDGKKGEPKASPKGKAKAEPKKEGGKKQKGGDKAPAAEEKPAEKTPEDIEKEKKAKLKKVVKEGGKRGVEIEGAADMGGLKFFCTSVDEPEGDLDLMEKCMEAMNAQPAPDEEERKGCSGHIGKMIFSAGDHQLGVVAYIPEQYKKELNAKDWIKKVLDNFGGEIVEAKPLYAKGIVKADSDKGKFPLKMKEPSITEAINFLKGKGLFPDADSDDDEYVFGDDDFPS